MIMLILLLIVSAAIIVTPILFKLLFTVERDYFGRIKSIKSKLYKHEN